MNFSEEWKSLLPVGSVFSAPLLISNPSSKAILGPLVFNPDAHTLTVLFKSPSLFPPLLYPHPQLSLTGFLSTTTTANSPVPYSTASSIASLFLPQLQTDSDSLFSRNHLQFLKFPNDNAVIVFFSTGSNHNQVGFLFLFVKERSLHAVGDQEGGVFVANKCSECFHQRIVRILVSPAVESDYFEVNASSNSFGYLLVYTMNSVHWYYVKVGEKTSERPVLHYAGWKSFKRSSIVDACWSPHLQEESLVLLDNGTLFLFDLNSGSSDGRFRGTKVEVPSGDFGTCKDRKWLGCLISWRPRTFIVACSDAVFLVDCHEYKVTCLANIDMFGVYAPAGTEKFLALSKAFSDPFHFLLASENLLVLCDVRSPLMPVLQWAHGLDNPYHIDVFRLSSLRSNSTNNTHDWATASGFGIILGSFWHSEFAVFCYGPPLPANKGSMASEISKLSKSFYAWELPSDILLSGNMCQCGSCLLKDMFSKEELPEWIDWQQKEDIVLGFGILSCDLSSLLFDSDEFGGFMLIRLMSSGKLEAQRYSASWDFVRKSEIVHRDPLVHSEENLLVSYEDKGYKFVRKFYYFKLDYLTAYLNDNLSRVLDSNLVNNPQPKESYDTDFHEKLCEKLKICGLSKFRASPAIRVVFDNINLPTSIHEVALRSIWASLPIELLLLAFSSYRELVEVSEEKSVDLEFLAVSDLPQLPPYFLRKPSNRSTKLTSEEKQSSLVGPVIPLPVLTTLHELQNSCWNSQESTCGFSAGKELGNQCNEVMEVARETAMSDSTVHLDDNEEIISLSIEKDNIWHSSEKQKSFILYCPSADQSSQNLRESNCVHKDDKFMLHISKVHEKEKEPGLSEQKTDDKKKTGVGLELFDDLCPIQLKFDAAAKDFSEEELKAYNVLKKSMFKWQEEFKPYKSFRSQFHMQGT
ncbi:hypothetical protein M5689_008642 [Euphorbia peplus]|nr:hypothetical protein M5689_008642 [Euphorbia peplus]